MEKHNTHVLLESNSSSVHDYEEDENGNIKIDIDEDVPYNYYIEKKTKSPTKEIIIENNNIFQKEFEENYATEEINNKSQKKSEKKKKKEIFIKPGEYRFETKKIQPCFNEVQLAYDRIKEINMSSKNNNNKSHELKENKKNTEEDLSKDKNKKEKKRNTLNLLNFSNQINLDNFKMDDEENNDYQKKETSQKLKTDKSYNNTNNNKSDIINISKENEISIKPEQTSGTILLKDKIQYNNNESYEGYIDNKDNNNNIIINPEIINEKNITESNDKFLKAQKTENNNNINNSEDKNKKTENENNFDDNINSINNMSKEKEIENEDIKDNNKEKKDEINNNEDTNDVQLLREILCYNGNEDESKEIKNDENDKDKILKENYNQGNDSIKLNNQNEKENIDEKENNKSNNDGKNGELNENNIENISGDKNNIMNNSKEKSNGDKVNNIDSKNKLLNSKNDGHSRNQDQKPNLSLDSGENNKIKDKSKEQNKIKENVTDSLQIPQNINSNPSLQNISKNDQVENGDNLPMLLDKIQNSDNSYDINKNRSKENNLKENDINKSNEEGEDEFLKDKNKNENINQENKKRVNTEDYLENNLQNQTINKEKSRNENSNNNKTNENLDDINSKTGKIDEIILLRQTIPISYLDKKRQKILRINKLIPKKKRAFISKLVNPHQRNEVNKKEEIILPISSICFMTNNYIIQKKKKLKRSISNDRFFSTKLSIKKGEEEPEKIITKNLLKKFPKVYKKAIVSPDNKKSKFRKKAKVSKKSNNSNNLIDISDNNKNSNIFIDLQKSKRKKEKISLISKDKTPNEKRNFIIQQNDKILKELSGDFDGNDQVDISIHFSNKKPVGLTNNIFKNYKKIKYPVSAYKKGGKLEESLYKDLKDLRDKLDNKDEYFKQKCSNFHYDRHVGDEKTCPICRAMRRKGRKSEREKGLFSAFSFKEFRDKNRRSLAKLRNSLHQKEKENSLHYFDKKKFYDKNLFSLNNNIDSELKKKYMQFNGMNRLHKLRRCGSGAKLSNYRYDNDFKSFRSLNIGREIEKNGDDLERIQYHALRNYFHD